MKTAKGVSVWVRPRWATWLSAALLGPRRSPRDLANALGDERRSLVHNWTRQAYTVSPENAYEVGDAVFALGHGYSSGLLAILAAGYFGDFARAVRRLSTTHEGYQLAMLLVQKIPLAAEGDLAQAISPQRPIPRVAIDARQQLRAVAQSSSVSDRIRDAWQRRFDERPRYESEELRYASRFIDLAITIGNQRDLPMSFLWEEVARLLDFWSRVPGLHALVPDFPYETLDRSDTVLMSLIRDNSKHLLRKEAQ